MFNKDNRIFYISSDVESGEIGAVCNDLINLLAEDDKRETKEKDFKREPIKMYIQSFGGCIYDMWALIDIMLNSKTPIWTYCTGYAMSAGFKIFLAGHKRFMSKHAVFLYHQLSAWNVGKYKDMYEKQAVLDYEQRQIETYVLNRTKIPKNKLDVIREKKIDWYIRCEEALKLGIAHEVI